MQFVFVVEGRSCLLCSYCRRLLFRICTGTWSGDVSSAGRPELPTRSSHWCPLWDCIQINCDQGQTQTGRNYIHTRSQRSCKSYFSIRTVEVQL